MPASSQDDFPQGLATLVLEACERLVLCRRGGAEALVEGKGVQLNSHFGWQRRDRSCWGRRDGAETVQRSGHRRVE